MTDEGGLDISVGVKICRGVKIGGLTWRANK